MPSLTGISFAYPSVGVTERARLCLDGESLRAVSDRLKDAGVDVFLLSTCLRVEILWPGDPDAAPHILDLVYQDKTATAPRGKTRTDAEAFVHLCRVAAGLESPQIGEPEVLSQFRQAAAWYRSLGGSGLSRALESAMAVARGTRRLLGESGKVSLVKAAAERVLPLGKVAVLGSGAMARAAVSELGGVDVTVFSRREVIVGEVATRPWSLAPDALAECPAVISTVPGGRALLPVSVVERSLDRRRDPLLLIDLGMPPGFGFSSDDPRVIHIDVDQVAMSMEDQVPANLEEGLLGEAMLAWDRLSSRSQAGSVIAAMVEQADRAVEEEVLRFTGRLADAEDPIPVLRQLAHTVARRVLHPPIAYLGTAAGNEGEVDVLAEAFGVESD